MSMLTFLIYALSQNPEVLKILRQEILTIIGPNRRPDYDDIRKCRYLRAVINGWFCFRLLLLHICYLYQS